MSAETFYHVYELPERQELAKGFAFNGGNTIGFLNVDWFSTPPNPPSREEVEAFVRGKRYVKPGRRYLVLGSPGHTFVIEPEVA